MYANHKDLWVKRKGANCIQNHSRTYYLDLIKDWTFFLLINCYTEHYIRPKIIWKSKQVITNKSIKKQINAKILVVFEKKSEIWNLPNEGLFIA